MILTKTILKQSVFLTIHPCKQYYHYGFSADATGCSIARGKTRWYIVVGNCADELEQLSPWDKKRKQRKSRKKV